MKRLFLSLTALASLTAWAQFGAPRQNPVVPSVTADVVEDFKPATTNQENKQFPAATVPLCPTRTACISMVRAVGAVALTCLLRTRTSIR